MVSNPFLEELGFDAPLGLLHDVLVAQFQLDLVETLDIRVSYLAVLVAIALLNLFRPLNAVELQEEIQDIYGVGHVDEGKANTALGLQIFRQVKIVVVVLKLHVDQRHHISLAELYRDVPYHQGRLPEHLQVTILVSINNSIKVNLVVLWPN